ncbi:MAG: zinc-ribbon domain-containing protein [Lachnospiraceae bacterium]
MTLEAYCKKHPNTNLQQEWSEKNGELTPNMVLINSRASVWWHCTCGYEWRETVANRIAGSDCKKCKSETAKDIKKATVPKIDLTGKRFGRLTVISFDRIEKESKWLCRCDCDKETVVSHSCLTGGKTTSCGCRRDEVRKKNFKNHIHFVEGTCIEKIAAKTTHKNNTTGFRGVSRRENGRFRATITFKGKRYDLGTYESIEAAMEARLAGEKMVDEFVEDFRCNSIYTM